jgi:hypothetical protein
MTELHQTFNLQTNFMEILMLTNSIPKSWKTKLRGNILDTKIDKNFAKLRDLQELKFNAKQVYGILVDKKYKFPVSQFKWGQEFPLLNEIDNIWSRIYIDTHYNIRDTKMQSMQYKILCRIINCKKKLFDWKILEDKKCVVCGLEDDLQHFFIDCKNVKVFWKNVLDWWNRLNILEINLYREELRENLLFGFLNTSNWYNVLNYVIMCAKWYIYMNRINNIYTMYMSVFLKQLKHTMLIEENRYHVYGKPRFVKEFIYVLQEL